VKKSRPLIPFLALVLLTGCASSIVLDRTVTSAKGVVVCVDHLAARTGARVLAEGGNAIDAAVAVGFALAVTHPQAGNLGGGGFMVIRLADGTTTAVDFRERAPLASTAGMFLEEDGTVDKEKRDLGFLSSGVPGTVAGLELAHRRYGRHPWRRLLEPAVLLAADGFEIDADLAAAFEKHEEKLRRFDSTVSAYFGPGGEVPEAGGNLVQPALAETLRRIRDRGSAGFYRGPTAGELIRAIREGGGIMTLEDLASYRAMERQPVTGTFRGVTVVGMPLPSSGGTVLIELLNILSGFDLAHMDAAARLHVTAEALRLVFRDRALHLGDADMVDVPLERLLSAEHARALRAMIDRDRAADSLALAEGVTINKAEKEEPEKNGGEGKKQTTHFSVMDSEGNMVAATCTLEQTFGCKAVAGSTRVLLNNEMHDFNVRPGWTADDGAIGTAPNLIAPGKRMLSSMCPVILLDEGAPRAVLGSPGGRTIISTVLLVLIDIVELGLTPEEAVAAARIHHQWFPDRLCVEKRLSEAIRKELERRGHTIKETEYQGDCHIIVVDPVTGLMTGVADRRIDGFSAGVR